MIPYVLQPRPLFAVLLAAAAAILGTALASQYLGGLQPCELCLWQRYPYAVVIGLSGIGFGLAGVPGMPRGVLAGIAALIALALAADAAIAVFHVGVEQHWWQGAAGCTGETGGARTAADLARQLKATPVVRCDEVAWSFLGISMAG
ncbi:MAG: disulfide bond formation protein B, partial [Alphaproteobacteria bacterium]